MVYGDSIYQYLYFLIYLKLFLIKFFKCHLNAENSQIHTFLLDISEFQTQIHTQLVSPASPLDSDKYPNLGALHSKMLLPQSSPLQECKEASHLLLWDGFTQRWKNWTITDLNMVDRCTRHEVISYQMNCPNCNSHSENRGIRGERNHFLESVAISTKNVSWVYECWFIPGLEDMWLCNRMSIQIWT